jgi:hypothetical protein
LPRKIKRLRRKEKALNAVFFLLSRVNNLDEHSRMVLKVNELYGKEMQ